MAFGIGRLGWPPEQFWRATPREIGAALSAHRQAWPAPVPDPASLRALMTAHPDAAAAASSVPERKFLHGR